MTKTGTFGAALVLFAAFSATAEAKLYKWVDDKGVTHYGETVPPEYANKDRVQFNDKGSVVKKKASPEDAASGKKTPEEQAAIEQRRKDRIRRVRVLSCHCRSARVLWAWTAQRHTQTVEP